MGVLPGSASELEANSQAHTRHSAPVRHLDINLDLKAPVLVIDGLAEERGDLAVDPSLGRLDVFPGDEASRDCSQEDQIWPDILDPQPRLRDLEQVDHVVPARVEKGESEADRSGRGSDVHVDGLRGTLRVRKRRLTILAAAITEKESAESPQNGRVSLCAQVVPLSEHYHPECESCGQSVGFPTSVWMLSAHDF
jgi:hypothetical protein